MSGARQARRVALVGLVLVLAAGCATREEPALRRGARARSEPKPKRCQPKPVKVTFKYAPGLSDADRNFVKKVSDQAISYFRIHTPHCVKREAVNVRLYAVERGSLIARATYAEIQVFTESRGWDLVTPAERAQVLFHEWYHVLQRTLSIAPVPPTWLIEGSAEWSGFDAAVHFGYFQSMDYVRRFIHYDARRPPKPLHEANPKNPGVYSLYFTSVDFLVSKYGGKHRLRQFWERYDPGESWREAFRDVFHVKASTFLKKFEAYRGEGFSL